MALSILSAENFLNVADLSTVRLTVKPTDETGDVELFERIIPFDATASNRPPFKKVQGKIFPKNEDGAHVLNPVTSGSLYQALAFSRGLVSGVTPDDSELSSAVGRVELPCIHVEERDRSLLTACAGVPQLILNQDNNALRASLATGPHKTRMLLLVGYEKPDLVDTGQGKVPRFGPDDELGTIGSVPLATGSSLGAARLHRVDAPSGITFSQIDELPPGKSYWFIALVWTEDGHWDFTWSKEGSGSPPLAQTALTRSVEVEVLRLTCVNDDTFDDDATFTLELQDRGGQELDDDRYTWKDMETGQIQRTRGFSVEWTSDEGSIPTSISIAADDHNHGEVELLPFPVGDGAHYNEQYLRIEGISGLPPGDKVFYADLKITVSYT